MKKKTKVIRNMNYTADSVIDRGYGIYDVWQSKALSSRKVVRLVEKAVAATRKSLDGRAYAEALAHIFALDLRIKERYNTLLRRIFSFFAYRRERGALERVKNALGIPKGVDDIRTAIEVKLKRLRESIKEADEEGDDEAHGGKRNGRSAEEEKLKAEGKEQEASEKSAENEPSDKELEDNPRARSAKLRVAEKI